MGGILLETIGLQKKFGGLVAVDGVDMHVREGEILGLIGPNGAGKTTLFNLLTGVHKASAGTVRFSSTDITRAPVHVIAGLGVARTFQNIKLFSSLSCEDNVKIAMYPRSKVTAINSVLCTRTYRLEMERIEKKTLELLSAFGLADKAKHKAGSLAYGEQRYLEIARALATDPKLIILDEPGAGMNGTESEMLVRHIRKIRETGHTVLLIEHDMNVIMEVCDRIYVVNFGKKIADGTPAEIRSNPKVIEAYLGAEDDDDGDAGAE